MFPKSSVSVTIPENSKFPPGFTLPPFEASSHSRSLPGERGNEGQDRQRNGDQRDTRPDPDRDTFPVPVGAHARSLTRSPSNPEGRKMRTRIRTKNAKTSW